MADVAQTPAATARPPVLEIEGLKKHFPIKKGFLRRTHGHVLAVDGVSFTIQQGEALGLVGESGCGKSTVGRTILRLIEPTDGVIRIGGENIGALSKAELKPFRRQMQIIFQDPYSSLNPRMSVGDIVGEPLSTHGIATGKKREEMVAALFDRVGLTRAQMRNFPHQFSGGQRQRIGIARALALNPKLIICDEPVSALDVSIQAQVINLLMDLQRDLGLSYLFISHNLSVVEHISQRIAVMYLGRIVEYADKTTHLHQGRASLHRGVVVGGAGAGPEDQAQQDRAAGRRAEPRKTAERLPLPHPLPVCGRSLQGRRARTARDRAAAVRGVPFAVEGRRSFRTPSWPGLSRPSTFLAVEMRLRRGCPAQGRA